jgi:hypothetical protein
MIGVCFPDGGKRIFYERDAAVNWFSFFSLVAVSSCSPPVFYSQSRKLH